MKTVEEQAPSLEATEHYLEAVCCHVSRVVSQLDPLGPGQFGRLPEYLSDPARLPLSSTFGVNLAVCLQYLRGESAIPADELPDLLQAVHEVVYGVSGCEDLEAVVLAEHQRIASIP